MTLVEGNADQHMLQVEEVECQNVRMKIPESVDPFMTGLLQIGL